MARGLNVFVNIGAKLLPSLNSVAGGVEKRFAAMNRRLRVQAAETKLAMKELNAASSGMMGLAAAGGLVFTAKMAIGNSAKLAHELQMMRNAGRTSIEVSQAMAQANRTISQLPTSTLLGNLKVMNETTMAFGSFKHAAENLTFVQKMEGMLGNVLGDKAGESGESAYSLIKAMEMRGMGTKSNPGFDSKRFQHEAGLLYQSSIASGGKVSPQEFFGYVQQANPYMKGMSERFLYRVAPTLIQENGGDRAGTMQNTWMGTILGKAKNKISTEAWMSLGLLDPKQVVYNKVGPVGWKPGAIQNTNLALSDPLKWSESVLIPALRAHGYDTGNQLSLAKGLMPLFRDRNAMRLASMLVGDQDRARIHKDEGLINKTPGVDKAYKETLRNDPIMAWGALKSSMTNLSSVLFGTGKGESPIAVALTNIAMGINKVTLFLEKHPALAKGIGVLLLGSAGLGALKVLGIGLRFLLGPLGGILRFALWIARTRFGGLIANGLIKGLPMIGRLLGGLGARLGPLALRGLMMLGPWLLRGALMAFGLLSNPVGWAILAVTVAVLLWKYRAEIAKGWKMLCAWFTTTAWPAVKRTVMSIDWKSIGWFIADALTFGLASKLPMMLAKVKGALSTPSLAMPKGIDAATHVGPGLAGMRARGGYVRAGRAYLVGEHGPEVVTPGRGGYVHPAGATRAMLGGGGGVSVGAIHIYGANDPEETARAVDRRLRQLAGSQDANLSD